MAEDIIKTRIKDAPIDLLIEQFLNAYILGDSSASGTGKILGKTIIDYTLSKVFDSICETQEEFLAAITSDTIHTILWKGNATLIDFVATAGTFKLIYCQHYSLLGKNSTLVSPAGKNVTIYGDINCAAPVAGGYSWTLNSTTTSYIKCKWIKNSGTTGKIICEVGTVLYERLESGLILETNGTVGSESYINQEFWNNTNIFQRSDVSKILDNSVPAVTTKTVVKIETGYTKNIGSIDSSVVTLLFILETLPDVYYEYEYRTRFITPETLGITTFKVAGPGNEIVAVGNTLNSKVIKFSAAQLNHIYATLADQTIVTATASISYVTATSTLSVGAETFVLDGSATEDVYFVCSSAFGVVTAIGASESDVPTLYQDVTWIGLDPDLVGGKTYEISVVSGCAVIGGSV